MPLDLVNGDGLCGASASAGAAGDASGLIDSSLVAIQFDCANGAGSFAGTATKALVGINFCSHFTIPPNDFGFCSTTTPRGVRDYYVR